MGVIRRSSALLLPVLLISTARVAEYEYVHICLFAGHLPVHSPHAPSSTFSETAGTPHLTILGDFGKGIQLLATDRYSVPAIRCNSAQVWPFTSRTHTAW